MRIEYPSSNRAPQAKALWKAAFGDEGAFIDLFFARAFFWNRCRIGLEGDEVTAMLYWLDAEYRGEQYAYLYAVAVHPAFRGRGACRALMEDTAQELVRRGYAGALLYPAAEELRRMYEKLGYRSFGAARAWACAAGTPRFLREIGPAEYARLRRRYLPAEGVIQEGASLELLAGAAKLYAGEDFLLAASGDGETLDGTELLGEAGAAPGILGALGCKTGKFRQGRAAMWRPLRQDAPEPGYLGLVFD